MTILIDEQIPGLPERLADLGETRTFVGRALTRQDLIDSEAEILLVRSTTLVNGALLQDTPVRFVGSATAGVDHVDAAWLRDHHTAFAYAPGSNAPAVAQYVLTVIDRLRAFRGHTLGIVGFGHVGSRLAAAAEQLGMSVLVNDPPLLEVGALMRPHTDLLDLLRRSDVVSLHVPITHDGAHPTHHLLNAETLTSMRPGTLLINTARGGVIDEAAIPDHIDLVVDVFEGEPILQRSTVERALIATPHIAGYTVDAKQRGADAIAFSLRSFLKGAHPSSRERSERDPTIEQRATSSEQRAAEDEQRAQSSEQRVITPDPRRLQSDLKSAWLADPTPETFDRCRKAYVLV